MGGKCSLKLYELYYFDKEIDSKHRDFLYYVVKGKDFFLKSEEVFSYYLNTGVLPFYFYLLKENRHA